MIIGRLVEVNDKYHAILNLKHPDGRRLQKRFNLELPVPNNKQRAQEKLNALCAEYTRKQQVEQNRPNVVLILRWPGLRNASRRFLRPPTATTGTWWSIT